MAQTKPSYPELVAKADAYLAKKDYYNAKTTYQLALQIDAEAVYPKNKIAEIIQKLNGDLDLRIFYEDKMQNATDAYTNKDYQKSITLYKEAAAILDYEEKPKQEIARIEKELEAIKMRQNKFDQILKEAQIAKQKQDYRMSLSKFQEANDLIPANSDVLTEIAKIKMLLKQQASQEEQFKNLVTDANKKMMQERFQLALKSYQEAALLFPDDNYVKSQLVIVDKSLKKEEA